MAIALTSLNCKYIHPNMALRILANELRENNIAHDVKEYTIKHEVAAIVAELAAYDIIACSCYIWNIELIKEVIKSLKKIDAQKIIILGGPEVSYLNRAELIAFACDYIVCGEGENVFKKLIAALLNKEPFKADCVIDMTRQVFHNTLNVVSTAYFARYTNDFTALDLTNQIAYLETARGCPYQCAYCLASLDNKIRALPLAVVFAKISYLLNHNARTIKLLDRTFNFNECRANQIISYILAHDNKISTFQFEVTGELLPESTIALLNNSRPGLFRLEIGIQSINEKANEAVCRYQNIDQLVNNIKKLTTAASVALHLDLIAGLPYDDLSSFKETFNFVFGLKAAEIQLGILKLLHGTKLNALVAEYDYVFAKRAPYQLLANRFLTAAELSIIEQAEKGVQRYYNSAKANEVVFHLITKYSLNAFDFFYALGQDVDSVKQLAQLYMRLTPYLKDEEDYVCFYNNYYVNSRIRLQALSKIAAKKEILKRLNELKLIEQNTLYRYCNLERVAANCYYLKDFLNDRYYVVKI